MFGVEWNSRPPSLERAATAQELVAVPRSMVAGGFARSQLRVVLRTVARAPRRHRDSSETLAICSLGVLCALVAYVVAGPIVTDDFWFHLAMGRGTHCNP